MLYNCIKNKRVYVLVVIIKLILFCILSIRISFPGIHIHNYSVRAWKSVSSLRWFTVYLQLLEQTEPWKFPVGVMGLSVLFAPLLLPASSVKITEIRLQYPLILFTLDKFPLLLIQSFKRYQVKSQGFFGSLSRYVIKV